MNGGLDGFLNDALVDVMAPLLARVLADAICQRMSPEATLIVFRPRGGVKIPRR